MGRQGSRQRLGTGPVTGPLERPSQGAPENRKAEEARHRQPIKTRARNALAGLLRSDMSLLVAAQYAERQQAIASLEAALAALLASSVAAVVAQFGARKSELAPTLDPVTRAAEMRRLMSDEVAELARLITDHASRLQRERRRVQSEILPAQRAARRALNQSHRRQKIAFAMAYHVHVPARTTSHVVDRHPPIPRRVFRSPHGRH